ncbi:hypothetical protein GCM10022406_01030 [Hymenobacter algoricola]|uniref:Outer membrane protein beta-barrel domain-containing protein n=1 Tax=Hymenobacter algoricola TaxID=486267 RepID=A0ABP7MAD0_9BACT
MESNRGKLPPKTKVLRRVAPVFSLGLRYTFTPRWTGVLDVRTASLLEGIKTRNLVLERDAAGNVISFGGPASQQRSAPAHFTLGAAYTLNPAARFKVAPEIGVGYMIVRQNFASTMIIESGIDQNRSDDEEEITYVLEPKYLRRGSAGAYAGLSTTWQLTVHSGLSMAVQYYHGFDTISELRSTRFQYINRRTGINDNYEVVIRNNGRYVAAKVLYSYTF